MHLSTHRHMTVHKEPVKPDKISALRKIREHKIPPLTEKQFQLMPGRKGGVTRYINHTAMQAPYPGVAGQHKTDSIAYFWAGGYFALMFLSYCLVFVFIFILFCFSLKDR